MDDFHDEFHGSDAQQALLRRGRAMFDVTRDDPGLSYYGRTVGLAEPGPDAATRLAGLVALQGNSNIARVPDAEFTDWRAAVEARGLAVTHYARWVGTEDAMAAAQAILDTHPLPGDLTVVRTGSDTLPETMAELARVALACGVLPPAGAVLRWVCKPGLGLVALDRAGRGVACAGAASFLHPDHPLGARQCWWGMLATLPERRGARLSLILGAMALLDAHDRAGFSEVFTGVEPGNAPSEAVCRRMGLHPERASVLGVADPAMVPGGRMTK